MGDGCLSNLAGGSKKLVSMSLDPGTTREIRLGQVNVIDLVLFAVGW